MKQSTVNSFRLLTVGEAAQQAGCCEETIRRAYWMGHLKTVPFGTRNKRIRQRQLDAWIDGGMRIR